MLLTVGMGLMVASAYVERQSAEPSTHVVDGLAAPVGDDRLPGASDPASLELVAAIEAAGRTTAYDGTKVVQRLTADGTVVDSTVIEVANQPGLGTVVQSAGADGVRAGQAFTPHLGVDTGSGAGTTTVRTADVDAVASSDEVARQALERSYRVSDAGEDKVSGRPARVVDAHRVDGSLAARLTIDEETGLLLRRELFDRRGATVETSAFVRLRIGTPAMDHVPPIARAPWETVPEDEVDRLRSTGWSVPERLRAGLELAAVRRDDSSGEAVLHLSYTDGLLGVSVFQQRGALDESALTGYVPATVAGSRVWVRDDTDVRLLVWQSGDVVLTATSDAPTAPLAAVVRALPGRPGEPVGGLGSRVERGIQRVGEWLNPMR